MVLKNLNNVVEHEKSVRRKAARRSTLERKRGMKNDISLRESKEPFVVLRKTPKGRTFKTKGIVNCL